MAREMSRREYRRIPSVRFKNAAAEILARVPEKSMEKFIYETASNRTALAVRDNQTSKGLYRKQILTHSHSRVPLEVSSATFILLEITWE